MTKEDDGDDSRIDEGSRSLAEGSQIPHAYVSSGVPGWKSCKVCGLVETSKVHTSERVATHDVALAGRVAAHKATTPSEKSRSPIAPRSVTSVPAGSIAAHEDTTSSEIAGSPIAPRSVTSVPAGRVSAPHWKRAANTARVVEVATYVFMALGALAGLILAFQSDPACQAASSLCTFNERFPLFWTGLGISLGVAFQGLVVVMITAYIQARAADATTG